MIKLLTAIFVLLGFLGFSVNIFAVEEMNKQISVKKVEVKDVQTVSSANSNISSSPAPSPVIKTENSNFEAKGKITSISGDNFDIEGITIIKNPQYLISISGNIEVGRICEVKGVLANGLRYAKEIKIENASSQASPPSTEQPVPQATSNSNKPIKHTPEVLSEIKINPNPPVSANPTPKPTLEAQPPARPQVSTTPRPGTRKFAPVNSGGSNLTMNLFFDSIKPVLSFFGNLFKGWF